MNELNKQYFETKRKHKLNYSNRKKITWKKRIFNLLITIILIYFSRKFFNHLRIKHQENVKQEMLKQKIKNPVPTQKIRVEGHKQ